MAGTANLEALCTRQTLAPLALLAIRALASVGRKRVVRTICKHPPQFLESLDVSTQSILIQSYPHDVFPEGHWHLPPVHDVASRAHLMSQPPQLSMSVCISTHRPKQVSGWADGQPVHLLSTHLLPCPQAMSHDPQLNELLVWSTHSHKGYPLAPPGGHAPRPSLQVHLPPTH